MESKPSQAQANQASDNEAFYCPISCGIMQDPVIFPDGYTYERTAIEQWLSIHHSSPYTRQRMEANQAIQNRVLKDQIDSMKDQVPQSLPQRSESIKFSQEAFKPSELFATATEDGQGLIKIAVGAKDKEECPPTDLVCVVDISGSMGASCAGITDGKTEYVDTGFSLLDLVKHALKTIIKTLRPIDRMSLILFDDQCDVAYTFLNMTPMNQKMAVMTVDSLEGRDSTNIYNALQKAINMVHERDDKQRNPAILFFTDGVPNVSPARGEIEALKKIQRKLKFTCPIHTFGFGMYNRLNSSMLLDIAVIFGGMNGYISDPTSIGTTFVNGISNILTTAAVDVKLDFGNAINSCRQRIMAGEFSLDNNGIMNIGTVRYGQQIEFLVKVDPEKFDKNSVGLKLQWECNSQNYNSESGPVSSCDPSQNIPHMLRFETIDLMKKLGQLYKTDIQQSQDLMAEHIKKYEDMNLQDNVSKGILQNMKMQITQALMKEKYMNKWGKHQFRQLARGMNMQCKINFRDPAVANFGGEMFEDFADRADDIFIGMDPPKPSRAGEAQVKIIQSKEEFAEVYNDENCGAGCFLGESLVQMADGTQKQAKDLQKGEMLATPDGTPAKLLTVIKFNSNNGYSQLCKINKGLFITHKHPIYHNDEWVFPKTIKSQRTVACEAVYNLITDKVHIVIISGVPAILMGHSYQEGILKHEYLGSQEIRDDLAAMPGWDEGFIELEAGCFQMQNGSRSKLVYTGKRVENENKQQVLPVQEEEKKCAN